MLLIQNYLAVRVPGQIVIGEGHSLVPSVVAKTRASVIGSGREQMANRVLRGGLDRQSSLPLGCTSASGGYKDAKGQLIKMIMRLLAGLLGLLALMGSQVPAFTQALEETEQSATGPQLHEKGFIRRFLYKGHYVNMEEEL